MLTSVCLCGVTADDTRLQTPLREQPRNENTSLYRTLCYVPEMSVTSGLVCQCSVTAEGVYNATSGMGWVAWNEGLFCRVAKLTVAGHMGYAWSEVLNPQL